MAGKNHIERSFRIYFDDGVTARDLTASLIPGSVTGGGKMLDEVDMTAVSDTMKSYLAGHADSEVSAQFHLDDTATTGAFTVLMGMEGTGGTLTLQWGQSGSAPTTGDPEWEGEYVLMQADCAINGGKAVINARWRPQAGQTAAAWGTVA